MRLKTYRAKTMQGALAAVKKDLGKDAVILHTRSYKRGAFFGWGGRTFIEITASDDPRAIAPRDMRRLARPEAPARAPASRAGATGSVVARAYGARDAEAAAPGVPARGTGVTFERTPMATSAPVAVQAAPSGAPAQMMSVADTSAAREVAKRALDASPTRDLQAELADIKRMVGQVLQANVAAASREIRATGYGREGVDAPASARVSTGMPGAMLKHYCKLIESEVAQELADEIMSGLRDELEHAELGDDAIVRQALLRKLEGLLPAADAGLLPSRTASGPQVIALIGPTGVGKTTTIAKLAAAYKLRHAKKVGLITCDTYRIAAVDQLRTYANIIGVPLKVVLTPEEMRGAIASFGAMDAVLVDTAGRSPSDGERLGELAQFLSAAQPSQTHLVLSSVVSETCMVRTAERFAPLNPSRVIFTKLDEAVNFGVLVNVAQRLSVKLSYVTTGQEVPDDIEPGRPERLARLVLDGAAA